MENFGAELGLSFVNAGQRQVNDKAELVVNSTKGGFTLSGAATALLGVAHGEYVQFVSNVDKLAREIKTSAKAFVDFCAQHGLTPGSNEATDAYMKTAIFCIAKGTQMLDKVGNPVMTSERLSAEDKKAYAKANLDEMLKSALASGKEELVEALSRDGITEEEKIEILAQYVSIETEKYTGSKCASSSKATGAGVPLKFSDGNVWGQMKRDIAEDARTTINRVYSLDVAHAITMQQDNGYEAVDVTVYPLVFEGDEAPMRRGDK